MNRAPTKDQERVPNGTETFHTYCAMCTSRCGVVATVEDGKLTQSTPIRLTRTVASASKAPPRRRSSIPPIACNTP